MKSNYLDVEMRHIAVRLAAAKNRVAINNKTLANQYNMALAQIGIDVLSNPRKEIAKQR